MTDHSIICAISTPPGSGGVAIIRLSGEKAIEVAEKVFVSRRGKKLADCLPNTIHFGEIRKDDAVIDEVLVSLFHAPHSYTGENTVEIACHGSVYIQQQILQLLIEKGASLALPGEFTQRAFLNGKMDLSQAEAVADLIASTSAGMHKLALNQMRGGFSNELSKLRSQLLDFTSLIELELDFSEEDVEFADRTNLKQLASQIEQLIQRLADSFNVGNAIKNGIPVAIIGETNAGKSTLLNLLLGEERAIVSDIHGTTRDVIEDTINLSGITLRFIDTAGIRETSDTIESLGIERTFNKLKQASIVLWVIDLTSPSEQIESLASVITPHLTDKKTILVFNKSDLLSPADLEIKKALLNEIEADRLYISAKKKENTELLKQQLLQAAAIPEISQNDVVVTNARHYEALTKAQSAIQRVSEGLSANISGDFLSQDIRECMHYLGEITGQISNDEILGNIFERFCVGK
ncbi:tRNA modification GTPase [Parabacteroides sp. PF5-5]|uniref:tRNA uridine-5-carboxymethylaminomethyl(34) synthesis GTPase MnmE n=1 Tax=unclassified Parabacteroides TaxID=2649774 RepID=UPI0024770520|nr:MULTISPECIES: tRNA uridine-5-carboxymethylaminomethyl(34) synthesis GTPase MnmE [unclassified Parabacteroides]MDH6306856.1 tRNA modification GTPase [Parabacteroides sp. PH5-39]MDH6316302.1 tRNA modification GTPase [Parabacteroides sp. PF5-13]MDH6319785.1 tRNA modification GTPase [Parabacteroides sp. PH5-13]MDH6323624.1 tRNA modification GTPase [Parabacteroides sp. PH5-8]MDH6327489.1 tRNA modification GTPase [Parabacteroides sp. PH5-41]